MLLIVELFLQVFSFPSWGHAVQRILWGIILNKDEINIIKIMNKRASEIVQLKESCRSMFKALGSVPRTA